MTIDIAGAMVRLRIMQQEARIAELEAALSAIIDLHQTASSAAWEAAQMTAIARACAALKGESE